MKVVTVKTKTRREKQKLGEKNKLDQQICTLSQLTSFFCQIDAQMSRMLDNKLGEMI